MRSIAAICSASPTSRSRCFSRGSVCPSASMQGLIAGQKQAPSGFMLVIEVQPAALARSAPLVGQILQRGAGGDAHGIETEELLGYVGRQADESLVGGRI